MYLKRGYLCIYVYRKKKPNFPERFRANNGKKSEYSGTKFKQADDKESQPICWQNRMETKKKKKKKKKKEKKTIFNE